MKGQAATGRTRRSRGASSTASPPPTRRQPPADLSAPIDAAHRHGLIAEAAYYRAETRGFGATGILDDWLAAEREIDRLLLEQPAMRSARAARQGR